MYFLVSVNMNEQFSTFTRILFDIVMRCDAMQYDGKKISETENQRILFKNWIEKKKHTIHRRSELNVHLFIVYCLLLAIFAYLFFLFQFVYFVCLLIFHFQCIDIYVFCFIFTNLRFMSSMLMLTAQCCWLILVGLCLCAQCNIRWPKFNFYDGSFNSTIESHIIYWK